MITRGMLSCGLHVARRFGWLLDFRSNSLARFLCKHRLDSDSTSVVVNVVFSHAEFRLHEFFPRKALTVNADHAVDISAVSLVARAEEHFNERPNGRRLVNESRCSRRVVEAEVSLILPLWKAEGPFGKRAVLRETAMSYSSRLLIMR